MSGLPDLDMTDKISHKVRRPHVKDFPTPTSIAFTHYEYRIESDGKQAESR